MISTKFPQSVIAAARASATRWKVFASCSLAQWALESNYGKAMPRGSNNPFGIKGKAGAPNVPSVTHEELRGRLVPTTAWFQHFDSLEAAFDAHAKLLAEGKPYVKAAAALRAGCDVPTFIRLFAPRYATDTHYADKLLSIIHVNDLSEADIPQRKTQDPAPMAQTKTSTPTPAPTSPDLLGMISDFVKGVTGKLSTAITVGNAVPQIVSGAVDNFSEIELVIKELLVVVGDIESGKWGKAPKDIEDLLKTIFDVLVKFGVKLPVLTEMVAKLPELPAIG